jgi:hypothetical protein
MQGQVADIPQPAVLAEDATAQAWKRRWGPGTAPPRASPLVPRAQACRDCMQPCRLCSKVFSLSASMQPIPAAPCVFVCPALPATLLRLQKLSALGHSEQGPHVPTRKSRHGCTLQVTRGTLRPGRLRVNTRHPCCSTHSPTAAITWRQQAARFDSFGPLQVWHTPGCACRARACRRSCGGCSRMRSWRARSWGWPCSGCRWPESQRGRRGSS